VVTIYWASGWPDLVVGIGIAAMNIGAANDVWKAARMESRQVQA